MSSTAEAPQYLAWKLIFVDDEILVKHRKAESGGPGLLNELVVAAEIMCVGQNADRRRTTPLIAQRDVGRLGVLMNPAQRGALALELGYQTGGRLPQPARHGGRLIVKTRADKFPQLVHRNVHLPFGNLLPLVGYDFFEYIHNDQ